MRIGVAATSDTLDAAVSERFGRCPYFLVVESDSMSVEAFSNPAAAMPGGAGPAAVQGLSSRGVEAVLAGEFGPKAQRALDLAGIRSIKASGVAREAVARLQN